MCLYNLLRMINQSHAKQQVWQINYKEKFKLQKAKPCMLNWYIVEVPISLTQKTALKIPFNSHRIFISFLIQKVLREKHNKP